MMQHTLRLEEAAARSDTEELAPGAFVFRGLALPLEAELVAALLAVAEQAPFRHLTTPGGHVMSVGMTNAGPLGWTSDRRGYRYSPTDPATGRPWPPIPPPVLEVAAEAVQRAGFAPKTPDACLINRYEPGARMSLHQDRDERDLAEPIVSISLGLPAIFLFGGDRRSDPAKRLRLHSGDVVVFGGPSRKAFHGVAPLAGGIHEATGGCRLNVTLRHAG